MKPIEEIRNAVGLQITNEGVDGFAGWIYLHGIRNKRVSVVCSWGGGWEHVSIAYANKTPTWEEMCKVKDMFWNDEECVVQYHPPKSKYVNFHPYCLHLWRKVGENFETPPKHFVG